MLARFALPPATRTMHRQAGAVEPGISLPQAHYPNPHTARRSRPRIFTSLSWDFLYSWIRVPGLHLTRYGLQLATHQPCHGAAIPWMGGKEFRGSCCYALSWDASGHGHPTLTLALLGAECGCGQGCRQEEGAGGRRQDLIPTHAPFPIGLDLGNTNSKIWLLNVSRLQPQSIQPHLEVPGPSECLALYEPLWLHWSHTHETPFL